MGPYRVLGIDPSMTATGLAYADGFLAVYGGDAALGDQRLLAIWEAVDFAANMGKPHLSVIEDLPSHAQAAGITGKAQGVVRLALIQRGAPYVTVVPSALKKYATGSGNATKADMRMALYKRLDIDERDDNKVDAFWLRAMGLDHLGEPLVELPAAQRASLEKVKWPGV